MGGSPFTGTERDNCKLQIANCKMSIGKTKRGDPLSTSRVASDPLQFSLCNLQFAICNCLSFLFRLGVPMCRRWPARTETLHRANVPGRAERLTHRRHHFANLLLQHLRVSSDTRVEDQ